MRARTFDVVRVVTAALVGMAMAILRKLVGRSRRASWSLTHEMMLGAYRGTWSLMPTIGAVRWREVGEQLSPKLTAGLPTRPLDAAGLTGEWFEPPDDEGRVLLYFHGGGFVFSSMRTHGKLIGSLAKAASARTLGLTYRLAPEHPMPAAFEDAVAAYRHILASGVSADRVVLAGDSAGGNLVLTTLIALRDAGEPLPAAGVAICPWVDLGCSGDSFERNASLDFVGKEHCLLCADHFLAGADPSRPDISPLFADLSGLPPLLIQAGEAETLVDQIREFAQRLEAAGSPVELRVHPDMVHVWHLMQDIIPEAQVGIDEVADFVRRHTS